MKYALTPEIDGHGMNATLWFSGTKSSALEKARDMASAITSILHQEITCLVRNSHQHLHEFGGIKAFPDGKFINYETGDLIKL